MEILKDFGVSPVLLVAQIINFLIIFYLLKRFLYKPVINVIKKREDQIKKGAQEAEKARITLEEAEVKEKKILKSARLKADEMMKNAKTLADELIKESEERAKKQAEKLTLEAEETIKQESETAEGHLMEKVGKLAIDMLERSSTNLIDRDQQKILLKKAWENIKQNKNG
ncbi:MAG: F0F1 ATP synthase subunit B [Patescibacteria group bacterium]